MASPAYFYNNWMKAVQGAGDLNGASLKATLHTSSYTPNASTQSVYADLTNELSTANGYSSGGQALAGLALNTSGGSAILTASPTEWTATGGSITARYVVLRYVGTVNGQVDPLILWILVDDTGGGTDKTATTGNKWTVTWNAAGIYTATKSA